MTTKGAERQASALAEREQEAEDRASRILFSIKCLRPSEKYPYETAVFETEPSVPVGAGPDAREDAPREGDAKWDFSAEDATACAIQALESHSCDPRERRT